MVGEEKYAEDVKTQPTDFRTDGRLHKPTQIFPSVILGGHPLGISLSYFCHHSHARLPN